MIINFYDKNFSVLKPEIYSFKKNQWKVMSEGRFRRNYHSAALLLPDGSVLVGGGDVWNVEVFYPPYLFEKIEDKTIASFLSPNHPSEVTVNRITLS